MLDPRLPPPRPYPVVLRFDQIPILSEEFNQSFEDSLSLLCDPSASILSKTDLLAQSMSVMLREGPIVYNLPENPFKSDSPSTLNEQQEFRTTNRSYAQSTNVVPSTSASSFRASPLQLPPFPAIPIRAVRSQPPSNAAPRPGLPLATSSSRESRDQSLSISSSSVSQGGSSNAAKRPLYSITRENPQQVARAPGIPQTKTSSSTLIKVGFLTRWSSIAGSKFWKPDVLSKKLEDQATRGQILLQKYFQLQPNQYELSIFIIVDSARQLPSHWPHHDRMDHADMRFQPHQPREFIRRLVEFDILLFQGAAGCTVNPFGWEELLEPHDERGAVQRMRSRIRDTTKLLFTLQSDNIPALQLLAGDLRHAIYIRARQMEKLIGNGSTMTVAIQTPLPNEIAKDTVVGRLLLEMAKQFEVRDVVSTALRSLGPERKRQIPLPRPPPIVAPLVKPATSAAVRLSNPLPRAANPLMLPRTAPTPNPNIDTRFCRNCRRDKVFRSTLCTACSMYENRYKEARSAEIFMRDKDAPLVCAKCGDKPANDSKQEFTKFGFKKEWASLMMCNKCARRIKEGREGIGAVLTRKMAAAEAIYAREDALRR